MRIIQHCLIQVDQTVKHCVLLFVSFIVLVSGLLRSICRLMKGCLLPLHSSSSSFFSPSSGRVLAHLCSVSAYSEAFGIGEVGMH